MHLINFNHSLPELRYYQKDLYNARLTRDTNLAIQAETGSGKGTIIVQQIVENIQKVIPTLVIVPSEELVVNIEKRLLRDAPRYHALCSFVSGTRRVKNFDSPILVSTYQSLYRNIDILPNFAEVIYDEVHTSSAASPLKVLTRYGKAKHTGYSATIARLDNKPLDYIYNDLELCPISTRQLITEGYLADFDIYALPLEGFDDAYMTRERSIDADGLGFQQSYLSNNTVSQHVYDQWKELAYGTRTLINASGIDHAEAICQLFNDNLGYAAFAFIHSKMRYKQRKAVIDAITDGSLMGVVHINTLCMGVDIPELETNILLRRTNSEVMHKQQLGRTLRPKPNGSKSKFLDFVGNLSRLGSPTFPRVWTLESDPDRLINDPVIECPNCSIPICNRSAVVKQIYRFKDGDCRLNLPVLAIKNTESLRYPVTMFCDNCEHVYERNFQLGETAEGTYDRGLGVVEDNSLKRLMMISDADLNNYVLSNRLTAIVTNGKPVQYRRKAIVNGKFSERDKYLALLRIGESKDTALMYSGLE